MYPNRYPYTPAPGYTPENAYDPYQPAAHDEQRIYEPYEGQIITAPANTRFWRRGTEVFLHSSTIAPFGREMLYVVYPIRRQNNICSLRAVAISANEYRGIGTQRPEFDY
ncbi:hypothetical protein [Bacillus haynesii]|uniref:hypothetical protein n=1 Tax=Bacillus haynesii TaxID=1925021 RepID=UPI003D0693A7